LGLSEVLQLQTYGEMSQKQLTALKHIESSGRHLLELVNDMLDISRLEAQQMELTMGLCSLQQVCQNSYKEVEDLVLEKKQVYSIEVDPADLKVNADGRRLKQIITNLLSNASKFTPAGGRLGIQAGVNESEKKVTICVWDTGIGIREEDLPRLFQTFVQLDARLERQFNGTGLGLALVRRLTELHGGTISVESKIGEGSRFIVSLPLD
ncbi:MAG: ATP-binding protein, partial [Chloroflexota bacterium]